MFPCSTEQEDVYKRQACICLGTVIFIICAILMTKKRIDYIRYLSDVVNRIAHIINITVPRHIRCV